MPAMGVILWGREEGRGERSKGRNYASGAKMVAIWRGFGLILVNNSAAYLKFYQEV